MSRKRSIFVLGLALLLTVASMQVGSTGTYFRDTETSSSNTFTAWVSHPQTLYPSADTYIYRNQPSSNYGGNTTMQIRMHDIHECRALVRFDLSSLAGKTIESAVMKLYFYPGPTDGHTIGAYRIDSTWDEMTVTWDTQPGNNATATASTYINEINKWWSWNVTTDVQAFVSGTKPNYGWKMILSTIPASAPFEVYTEESGTANAPVLVVTYHTEEGSQ